jgi:hypothetical protein
MIFVVMLASLAKATETSFGPFSVDDSKPDIIALKGEIDVGSALNFRRALQAAPNAKLVTLSSPGGTVQMALLIADDIHQRKLSTYIAKGSGCYSACAYIFLAGAERQVDGELGVHQISSDGNDLVGAQLTISDIIDVLNRFDTPVEVMAVMFKTPPNDMHVFTQDEISRFKLNRKTTESSADPAGVAEAQGSETTPKEGSNTTSDAIASASPAPDTPPPFQQPQAKLSAIEEFTKRANRIAVYAGLDLFGDDLSSIRVSDAAECAKSCLAMNGQCKAFTFNTNPKILKGPNCFLKSSAGRADGNTVAFSGRFLSGAEADPPPFTMGTIDPQSALFHDIDLPGGDLSSHPFRAAQAPLDCRLACVKDDRCAAFTYIYKKKECWLKGAVGSPTLSKGLVSGVKKIQSFAPTTIISIN